MKTRQEESDTGYSLEVRPGFLPMMQIKGRSSGPKEVPDREQRKALSGRDMSTTINNRVSNELQRFFLSEDSNDVRFFLHISAAPFHKANNIKHLFVGTFIGH